jgi:hypothetical protein
MKRLPIGISDFKELIENDYLFADTTPMIGEIYREQSKILLITRPRRFGKTLNMSMLGLFVMFLPIQVILPGFISEYDFHYSSISSFLKACPVLA